jgi:hypothetical protein
MIPGLLNNMASHKCSPFNKQSSFSGYSNPIETNKYGIVTFLRLEYVTYSVHIRMGCDTKGIYWNVCESVSDYIVICSWN